MSLVHLLALTAFALDSDGDGVDDGSDGCLLVADPAQADGDGDGTGDACDVCAGPEDGLTRFPGAATDVNQVAGALVVEDLDGDGDPEVVVSSADNLQGGLYVDAGTGSGFAPVRRLWREPTTAITAADLDGDGDVDLAVGRERDGAILLLENVGLAAPVGHLVARGGASQLGFADLDGDGDEDLVVLDPTQLSWFENRGGFRFGGRRVVAPATPNSQFAVGDLDDDGDLDLATVVDDALRWYPNAGSGTFGAARELGAAAFVWIADLDDDGDDDLLTRFDRKGTFWWSQRDTGGFAAPELVEPYGRAVTAVEDVDGDGDPDLVIGGYGELSWRENLGHAVFADSERIGRTRQYATPLDARARDVDGDGAVDLVTLWDDGTTWSAALPCAALDSDADGLTDARELLVTGTDPTTADTDGDGLPDGDECAIGADPNGADSDGDGTTDGLDVCPVDVVDDSDADGICEGVDNCRSTANPAQLDADLDHTGDACDPCFGAGPDADADRWCDEEDLCELVADPRQLDGDGDGTGDACDVCPEPGDGLQPLGPAEWIPSAPAEQVLPVDLDGDGDQDLVSVDLFDATQTAYVQENLGGGAWGPARATALGPDLGQVIAADLDGDGDPDLAGTLDAPADQVVWVENLGGTTFGPSARAGTISDPLGLLAEDLDADGDLDLAVAASGSGLVQVLDNNGLGGFAPPRLAATLRRPVWLGAADVDADGDPDLVVLGSEAGVVPVSWLPNTNGAFGAPVVVSANCASCSELKVGDLDRDGDPDLLLGSSAGIALFEGTGSGFAPERRLALATESDGDFTLLDVDVDGDLDPMADRLHSLRWQENRGGLAFGGIQTVDVGADGRDLAPADLDGDGTPELLLGQTSSIGISPVLACAQLDADADGLTDAEELLVHGSDPSLSDTDADGLDDADEVEAGTDLRAPDTDADGTADGADACPLSAQGDLDGDGWCGDVDLCPTVPNRVQNDADGDGVGNACDLCDGEDGTGDTDADGVCDGLDVCDLVPDPAQADADHDGAGDACDACPGPSDGLDYFGAGHVITTCPSWAEICLDDLWRIGDADVDGDGDPDVVRDTVDTTIGRSIGLSWHENQGTRVAERPTTVMTVAELRDFTFADLDGDGDLDAVSADAALGLRWARNDGTGRFGAGTLVGSGQQGLAVVVAADLDGDGDADVAAGSEGDGTIAWYENAGNGTFLAPVVVTGAAVVPTGLVAADLDGDGDLDLAGSSSGDEEIAWYENTGGGAFGPQQVLTRAVVDPMDLFAGDLDADGVQDLLTGSPGGELVGLLGDGAGGFSAPEVLGRVAAPLWGFDANDPDGDGDLDVVAVGWGYHEQWLPNHAGRLARPQEVAVGHAAHAVDLDGDGDPELLTSEGAATLAWYTGLGTCAASDADADGLTNGEELLIYATDPQVSDTDLGSVGDGAEVVRGTDPTDPADDLQARIASGPTQSGAAAEALAGTATGCDTGGRAPAWALGALGALLLRRRGAITRR